MFLAILKFVHGNFENVKLGNSKFENLRVVNSKFVLLAVTLSVSVRTLSLHSKTRGFGSSPIGLHVPRH